MSIQANKAMTFVYEMDDNEEVKIQQIKFQKS